MNPFYFAFFNFHSPSCTESATRGRTGNTHLKYKGNLAVRRRRASFAARAPHLHSRLTETHKGKYTFLDCRRFRKLRYRRMDKTFEIAVSHAYRIGVCARIKDNLSIFGK